ncbi:MAG: glutamine--fructose-6-phosphate aminotransferase, partial [Patescibacteria group bacterium]
MCGIIGYIGNRRALPVLLDGLHRLEYRGYDSSGVAVIDGGLLTTVRAAGRIAALEDKIGEREIGGTIGIAHTRWATHGPPVEKNAHPHCDCKGRIAVVHNGIIENYAELRSGLRERGHIIASDTDTEVLAHLLEETFLESGDLAASLREVLKKVRGTYGIVAVSSDAPNSLVVARLGSP